MYSLLRGIVLGFGLVAPLGAQNVFIFQHSAAQSRWQGAVLPVVISIFCDSLLIILAATGGSSIVGMPALRIGLSIGGGMFLFFLGIKTWKSATNQSMDGQFAHMIVGKQVAYTLSVSLMNPHAIVDIFVVIGAVSSQLMGMEKWFFLMGTIAVDTAWFIALAFLGFMLKKARWGSRVMAIINRVSAVIMVGIGLELVLKIIR